MIGHDTYPPTQMGKADGSKPNPNPSVWHLPNAFPLGHLRL
jgi:hypothetical protein